MCALAGRGATARARNSARSPVVNPLQHGAGGVVHHDVAPRQYPPRDLEEPVPAHAGAARATPGEWGDVLGRPHVVEDVRARADHGPGAEQSADRRLRMVADQAAEQLQTGLETRPRELETHATVRVLQVRRDRAGAEVRPAADHAMADEAVVRLVRVPQEDAARQLAARVRSRADRRRAHRSAQHVGVRADPQGPLEPGPGAHLGAAFEYDRTVPYIEDDARFHGGVAQRNRGGIGEPGEVRESEDRSRLRADERLPPLADQVRAGPQLAQRACSDERRPRGGGVRIEQVEGVGHSRCTSSFKRSARPVGITSVWPLARTTTISSRPTTATCSLSDQITERRTSSATVAFPTTTLPCASGLRMRNRASQEPMSSQPNVPATTASRLLRSNTATSPATGRTAAKKPATSPAVSAGQPGLSSRA